MGEPVASRLVCLDLIDHSEDFHRSEHHELAGKVSNEQFVQRTSLHLFNLNEMSLRRTPEATREIFILVCSF